MIAALAGADADNILAAAIVVVSLIIICSANNCAREASKREAQECRARCVSQRAAPMR